MEKTIVFDMDGVLIDSERLLGACLFEAAPADCDRVLLERAFNDTLGVTIEQTRKIVLHYFGSDFPIDAFYAEAERLYFARIAQSGVPLKPGARELLDYLREQDYTIALASSSPRRLVEKELGAVDLLPYFSKVITGDAIKNSKPAPDIYLAACEALSVAPADAYAVEDSFSGIQSAHAAGLRVLGVPDVLPLTSEIRALCLRTFDTLFDVKDWLTACV